MKFAFMILGAHFDPERDRAAIHGGAAQILGVSSVEEACAEAVRLAREGIDCIELCGAFGSDGAKCVIDAVQNRIPVGYATHLPVQDDLFRQVFGE